MLTLLSLLACVASPALRPTDPEHARGLAPSTRVETAAGPVIGRMDPSGVASWLGLPFAAPPVGALRWRPAEPALPHEGVFVADRPAAPCMQSPGLGAVRRPAPSEDCLALNVWRPRGEGPFPVMVWIHGGGYINGGALQAYSDGALLAAAGEVVVVSVAYRLGAFGFLAHPAFAGEDPARPFAGNYGLTDQLEALRWVRDNIAAFGGDPARVTVFGESAGGGSVCALMVSPDARGLFHRAIVQSGVCEAAANQRPLDGGPRSAYDQGRRFAEAAGCAAAEDLPACLRARAAEVVQATLTPELNLVEGGEGYSPVVGGHALPEGPLDAARAGRTAPVPLLLSFTADEGSLFVQRRHIAGAADLVAFVERSFPVGSEQVLAHYASVPEPLAAARAILGDELFVCPALAFARAHAEAGNPTYVAQLTRADPTTELLGLGAMHATDLPLVFDHGLSGRGDGGPRELVVPVQTWWTRFAAEGAPGEAAGQRWRPVPEGHMELDLPPRFVEGLPKADTCALLDGFSRLPPE